jgi:hypothetical protein
MRARLAELGGTLERDIRHGTRLTLRVPKTGESGATALVTS